VYNIDVVCHSSLDRCICYVCYELIKLMLLTRLYFCDSSSVYFVVDHHCV